MIKKEPDAFVKEIIFANANHIHIDVAHERLVNEEMKRLQDSLHVQEKNMHELKKSWNCLEVSFNTNKGASVVATFVFKKSGKVIFDYSIEPSDDPVLLIIRGALEETATKVLRPL